MVIDAKPGDIFSTRNQKHAVRVKGLAEGIQGEFVNHGEYTVPTNVPKYPSALGLHLTGDSYTWAPDGRFVDGQNNDVDLSEKIEA
jgi:hypothetical protein